VRISKRSVALDSGTRLDMMVCDDAALLFFIHFYVEEGQKGT
jgi:hypothetical protein